MKSNVNFFILGIKAVTPSCVATPCGANSFTPTATPHNSPDSSLTSSRCGSPEPYEELSIPQRILSSMPQIFGVGGGARKKVLSPNQRDKSKKQQQEVIDENLIDLPVLRLLIFESLYRLEL